MRPLLHPSLVNGRFGDAALYMESLFERRAILCDLGDISALSARNIRRIDQIFVSHAHIDHFIGFDRLLRTLVGREKEVRLYGPPGFIQRVYHKLQGYLWNLVDRSLCDLVFLVTEINSPCEMRSARLRLKSAFACEDIGHGLAENGVVFRGPAYHVATAMLEHRTPCLAYAIEEGQHVNIWKNRLDALNVPVGAWLCELKRAVIENRPDDHVIHIGGLSGGRAVTAMTLAQLRQVLSVTRGQKVAYITDAADTPANREAIICLARDADILFIEANFCAADTALAAERAHLTTRAAGEIARAAGVKRVEPFHFSSRYEELEGQMLAEVMDAFSDGGRVPCSKLTS